MLKIVGFGSGAKDNMTLEASAAISSAQLIVGYSTYVDILKQYFPDKEYYSTNMMQEKERCQYAIDMAKEGRDVVLVCSGDSGVYGMASLVYELADEGTDIKIISGVTAANSGAACLGAPLSHDFAVISLSDCMTPWELIKKRIRAMAESDMVMCIYNPSSRRRAGYLKEACDISSSLQLVANRVMHKLNANKTNFFIFFITLPFKLLLITAAKLPKIVQTAKLFTSFLT